ncbi:MAG: hypothetical protein PUG23_06760 [Lachnospiraceae bacterium]|uniref:hypothetical protein n=1 Tax=unclassified Agathobacter TaxID=2641574 RepID=UPI002A657345|nr:hypothetical protein [Agathobacter sp.]MDD6353873.1 hypothetical protein [Lachnospiraceae bacterium]MDD7205153.1 hypothetical protein [Lachnospiraceae bacterium]MDY5863151.1 hypothetical protein [Agathobacter sp.]
MKNTVLGIIGCLIAVYTAMLSLSVYNVCVRRNQMEKTLSSVLQCAMESYYEPNMYIVDKETVDNYEVKKAIISDLEERFTADGEVDAMVYVCDMQKGIISAGVEEEFNLPIGITKKISCKKIILADQPMEE